MNLINEEITHKIFGEGSIVDQDESVITVDFNTEIKKFVYPDAFGKFITLHDRDTAKSLKKVISQMEMEKEALEKEREKIRTKQVLEQQRLDYLKNHKIHESSQIVFWLDEAERQDVFTDWQASVGTVQRGKNKGQPNRAARLHHNSACILTVRESDQPEEERRILGLYMVSESFTNDPIDSEMIPAHSQFRLQLTDEEAANMPFWNYYINKKHPQRMTWESGRYRYFDNVWTAQILKDITVMRTNEENKKEAEDFLEYFCQMNFLDMDSIPEAHGALKQTQLQQ